MSHRFAREVVSQHFDVWFCRLTDDERKSLSAVAVSHLQERMRNAVLLCVRQAVRDERKRVKRAAQKRAETP